MKPTLTSRAGSALRSALPVIGLSLVHEHTQQASHDRVSREEILKIFGCELDPHTCHDARYTSRELEDLQDTARLRASLYDEVAA